MKKYSVRMLIAGAFGAAFWAYTIIDTLIRDFHKDVSVIDIGALYFLGMISGIMLGLVVAVSRHKHTLANE